ncbi:MAG: hypothetical protein QXL94_01645 [Candidatus Parvarchaeum sp.]
MNKRMNLNSTELMKTRSIQEVYGIQDAEFRSSKKYKAVVLVVDEIEVAKVVGYENEGRSEILFAFFDGNNFSISFKDFLRIDTMSEILNMAKTTVFIGDFKNAVFNLLCENCLDNREVMITYQTYYTMDCKFAKEPYEEAKTILFDTIGEPNYLDDSEEVSYNCRQCQSQLYGLSRVKLATYAVFGELWEKFKMNKNGGRN